MTITAAQRADFDNIDREILQRAVLMARWDISHGREPGPERWEAATFGFVGAFASIIDPVSVSIKDRVVKEAERCGLTDRDVGEFDAEAMDLVMQAVEQAFWLGLTRGHMIVDGTVHLPRRLFPGFAGA